MLWHKKASEEHISLKPTNQSPYNQRKQEHVRKANTGADLRAIDLQKCGCYEVIYTFGK
jgi:hypothetical protein